LSTYAGLGMRRLINAFDTTTVHGGSRMSPGVLDVMNEASRSFVNLVELHEKAGRRVAELTRNEAAYITSGAASGLLLATAACMAGSDTQKMDILPDAGGMRNEIILKASQRIAWTVCARQAGAKLILIGNQSGTQAADLDRAIHEKTAAILYFAGVFPERDGLPLEQVIEIAHRGRIPVIVDAAAQLPPKENLWRFAQMGADLVIFSGGKGLRGPQCSGLILGKKELVEACAANGSPNCRIGRVSKTGKEEIMGLVTAVEEFIEADHEKIREHFEGWIRHLGCSLKDMQQISVSALYKDSCGTVYPKALLSWNCDLTKAELLATLKEGDPSIIVGEHDAENGILINPFNLDETELELIIGRLRDIFK
jgi:D-glucosaminate-6-phosphate ammonia-lyase